MGGLAELLPGIAACITSVGGIAVSLYAIKRGSKVERERSAEKAIDKVTGGGDQDQDDDQRDAIAAVVEEILKRQGKGGGES